MLLPFLLFSCCVYTWICLVVFPDFFFFFKTAMDSARLSAVKSSPMMETINMVCIDFRRVSV